MSARRPLFVICEDGSEYTDRFVRLFGAAYQFQRAGHLAEARAAARAPLCGWLLDLDFRRTPVALLVDEAGQTAAARTAGENRRLAGQQGILLLRALREGGDRLPALLFADIDDPAQVAFLESSLAPLRVIPSGASLAEIGAAFATIAASRPAS